MLDLVLLQFRDSALEREYALQRASTEFVRVDALFALFHLTWVTIHTGSMWQKYSITLPTVTSAGLLLFAILHWWVVGWFRCSLGSEWFGMRDRLVIPYRSLLIPLVTSCVYTLWFVEPVRTVGNLSKYLGIGCGLLITAMTAVFMPLLLKFHIPVQAVSLALLTVCLTPRGCDMAIQAPQGHKYFEQIWELFTGLSWRVLNWVYFVNIKEETRPPILRACEHSITWWLCVAGFVLPTWGLWLWEHESRARFLTRSLDEGRLEAARQEEKRLEFWRPLDVRGALWYVPIFILFLAVSWQVLMGLYIEKSTRSFTGNSL